MEALGETSACLAAAYDRADCEAASELIGGIERYPLDRTQQPNLTRMIDDVIRGHFGFCALATGASYDPPPPGSMIRLDRLGCGGGSCPIYGVTVDSEGHVVWEGKIFVDTMGHAERTISVQRARELFDAFERLSFAKGPHSFESNAEDARRARLTLIRGPMHHTFDDDDVNSTGAIRTGIAYLERRVDEIAQTAGWVSARDARAR